MTLRLHDTRAQELRDFVPLDPSNVTMYVCGPTVQSGPHIGHVRAALGFDLLRRWLEHSYDRVTFVRNVTDIDDKVLTNATAAEEWWALAYRMEREFTAAYEAVGILPPTYEPRATASIPQMQELIQRLIERGHAYAAAGDVYFDVRSWAEYGSLTHQSIDNMEAAADADPRGKRNPQDFALWKGAKEGEPASATWESPWGAGRPGWHIECSAMSRRYLGPAFDIHGGGLDLRFPHHENELAQSTAAGDPFATYWVHNGLVTVGGQKMSKSLGNFTLAADVLATHAPDVVRYALAAAHYRSTLDITDSSYDEANRALSRVRNFVRRVLSSIPGDPRPYAAIPQDFADALDDDLNVPQALAVLHQTVREGNIALDRGEDGDQGEVTDYLFRVTGMLNVLGFSQLIDSEVDGQWDSSSADRVALASLMDAMISQRAQARADKDWGAADRIRDALSAAGILLEDAADGTHWSINV